MGVSGETHTAPEKHPLDELSTLFENCVSDYLAIGMTLSEYWDGDPILCKWYRDAFRKRQSMENMIMWRQGRYFYDAMLCCTPVLHAFAGKDAKPIDYPKEPYPMNKQEAEAAQKRKEESDIMEMKARLDALSAANRLKKEIKNQGDINAK